MFSHDFYKYFHYIYLIDITTKWEAASMHQDEASNKIFPNTIILFKGAENWMT